jgi:hypothetical protein
MSGIRITKALYGTGTQTIDVLKAVTSNIKDGNLTLTVTPDALNIPDPAPGQLKTLDVAYTINNGKQMGQMVKDNEVLMISAPPQREASGLVILKAEYGYPGNFTDVTDAIQNHVSNGTINIKVGHKSAGIPDPNPNKQKSLKVDYELNGSQNTVELTDGKTLNISAPPMDGSPNTTPPSSYVAQLIGMIFKNLYWLALMFLYTVSIFATADFFDSATPIFKNAPLDAEKRFGELLTGFKTESGRARMGFLLLGALLPGVSYWGLPFYVFARRLFSNSYILT